MKKHYYSLSRIVLIFTLVLFSLFEEANAQRIRIKVKVKKPKITVGRPKVSVPSPATIAKNAAEAVAKAAQQAASVPGNVVSSTVVVGQQTADVVGNVAAATSGAAKDAAVATDVMVGQTANVVQNVAKAGEVAVQQVGATLNQGVRDVVAEAGRIPGHAVDVSNAAVAYLASIKNSAVTSVNDFTRRVNEGKIMDALFHAALAPLKADEEAAFSATQESGWVNAAGAVAASAYGGPGGSAAYAAWQTYRLSNGNMEYAIRAGLIAGLTNAASGAVNSMEPNLVRNVLIGGAIGGAAMAASGADEKAIIDGIILGGGMVLVQDAYKSYVGHKLDPTAPTEPPYCMNLADASCSEIRNAYTFDKDGNPIAFDPSKLDPKRSHVGIQGYEDLLKGPEFISEYKVKVAEYNNNGSWTFDRSPVMQNAAKVPGMNAMGLFHDKWAFDWNMGSTATKLTIIPAIAVTYVGTGSQIYTSIPDQVTDDNAKTTTSFDAVPQSSDNTINKSVMSGRSAETIVSSKSDIKNNLNVVLDATKIKSNKAALERLIALHDAIDSRTTAIISANNGVERLVEGLVKPADGWAWVNPADSSEYAVRKIDGIEVDSTGRLHPIEGWNWVDPSDPLNVQIHKIEGVRIKRNGKVKLSKNYRWLYPDNQENLEVVRRN